jgi:hypothetical protein
MDIGHSPHAWDTAMSAGRAKAWCWLVLAAAVLIAVVGVATVFAAPVAAPTTAHAVGVAHKSPGRTDANGGHSR